MSSSKIFQDANNYLELVGGHLYICANGVITRVDNQSGASVQSVVAGTNVTVDNTDPLNPIVSASGGVLSITGSRASPEMITPSVGIQYTGTAARQMWLVEGLTSRQQQTGGGSRNWSSVSYNNDGKILACEDGGYIWYFDGSTWASQSTPGSGINAWKSVCFSGDGTTAYAINSNQNFAWRFYSLTAWGPTIVATYGSFGSLACSYDGQYLIASSDLSSQPVCLTSNNGGTGGGNYDLTSRGILNIKASACFPGTTSYMAVAGTAGQILIFGGAVYTLQTTPGTKNWTGLKYSNDGSRLVACNSDGEIWSLDSGVWTQVSGTPVKNWSSISLSGDGSKIIACESGGSIWINYGIGWYEQTTPGTKNWKSVSYSNDGSKFIAAINGGYLWSYLSSINITANPQITIAPAGRELKLLGTSTINPVTIANGNGLVLSTPTLEIKNNTAIELISDGANWIENSRNNI